MTIHRPVAAAPAPMTRPFYERVQAKLRAALERAGHDGLLMLSTGNVVYSTGFFHSANERPIGVYVPVSGEPVLFVPLLEKENAEAGWIADVRTYDEFPGVVHPVLWMIGACGARRLAVDTIPVRLLDAARELAPHAVAFYLRDLAGDFHAFYNADRVLVDDDAVKRARLALLAATRQVLRNGLAVIGVSAPQKM